MPTVPTYKSRVAPAETPRVRVPTQAPEGTFGSGVDTEAVGRALGGAAKAVTNVIMEERQRADEVNVVGAKKSLTDLEVDLQFNQEYGYRGKMGKAAGESIVETQERWQKGVDEITNGLTNERQKFVFQQEAARRWDFVNKDLSSHAFRESRKYDDEQTEAFISNEKNAALSNYRDFARVEESVQNQKQEIYNYGKRNGLSGEAIKLRMDTEASKTYSTVVSQLLAANQDQAAKKYFDDHKDHIMGGDLARIEKELEIGSIRGAAQRKTDEIMAKGLPMQQALDEARGMSDPERKDETVRRIKERYQEKKAAQEQMAAELFMRSYNEVERSKNLDAISPGDWSLLKPDQRSTLKKLASGQEIKTDWQKYYDLKQLAGNPKTRDKFISMDLSGSRGYLADAEFKELTRDQANLRKNDPNTLAALDGFMSDKQVVDATLEATGFNVSPKPGTSDAVRYNEVMRHIDSEVYKWKARNNSKTIPNKEVQSIVDSLVVEGTVPGSGVPLFGPFGGPRLFQEKKKIFELDPGEQVDIDIESISKTERDKITEALRRKGLPVNDDTILELYMRAKLNR